MIFRRVACVLWAAFAAVFAIASAVAPLSAAEPNTLSEKERLEGWKLLFDGKTTEGWRNYKQPKIGAGWKVEDGALCRADQGAGDIVTQEQYGSFELSLEYKISKGGNSGLMFHVGEEGGAPWFSGPEIQIQDNKDGHDPQLSGWLYQLYKPEVDATRPAGEWNELRVLITREKCSTTMNGVKYYEFVVGDDDWNARVAKSKFASMPDFGKLGSGHICLQDHGNPVCFRSIKIRPVK